MAKGVKTGGRKRGSPNKKSAAIRERLLELGCDHVEYLALTVNNQIECGICRGTGKTPFQPRAGSKSKGVRICQSCWGSKLERLRPSERQQAATDLLKFTHPTLKAVEVTGGDGGPIQHRVKVVYVDPPKR